MKYIKLYLRFVIVYMKGKLEYNFALLLELTANTILIGVYFAGFWVIFCNFETVAGWSRYEVLFMFTTSWLAYSISCFFFWSPMRDMGELIRSGKFDLYLTRPISPFVYLVLQQFQ
ncbi:MAG: ABC-2 family transporter protein, partial [Clostridiales bacterium]|nr:ABC-2 family transporter protein [Clostridiales bacterium]